MAISPQVELSIIADRKEALVTVLNS